jgi:hypothetical protein
MPLDRAVSTASLGARSLILWPPMAALCQRLRYDCTLTVRLGVLSFKV